MPPDSTKHRPTTPEVWRAVTPAAALLPGKPMRVELDGMAIVLYRQADGQPVALDDRCPHRWAPLSDGRIQGDHIICPLHGFAFCPSGQLADTGGKPPQPGVGTARAYPAREHDGQIWLHPGNC